MKIDRLQLLSLKQILSLELGSGCSDRPAYGISSREAMVNLGLMTTEDPALSDQQKKDMLESVSYLLGDQS